MKRTYSQFEMDGLWQRLLRAVRDAAVTRRWLAWADRQQVQPFTL